MDVGARQSRGQLVVERFRPEPRARTGQRPDFPFQRPVPRIVLDPRRQYGIEDVRTRRGQQNRTLVAIHPAPTEHRARLCHVAAFAAEALLAVIVRHAARSDLPEHRLRPRAIAAHLAQHQHEAVAAQGAALEFARMPRRRQHFHLRVRERGPVRIGPAGQLHREGLPGHGMAILEARITDRDLRHAGELRQLARDPVGVGAALLHPQQQVLAGTLGVVAEDLLDQEVLGTGAQPGSQWRFAESMGQFLHGETASLGEFDLTGD